MPIQKFTNTFTQCFTFRQVFRRVAIIYFILLLGSSLSFAQKRNSRVRDSLLLEKAYRTSDTKIVTKMLNRWALKSISPNKIMSSKEDGTAIKIFNRFYDDFMNGRLTGILHNRDNGHCRFIKSPYLFIQPKFKYVHVQQMSDSLRHDVLKIASLAVSPHPELYQNFDPSFVLSRIDKVADTIQNIPVQIDKDLYNRFKNHYDILPISAEENYRKSLVNFWGYLDIRKGVTAIRYNDPSPEEKKRRLDFLNSGLRTENPEGKLIYFGKELEIGKIYLLANMHYAVVTYYIMMGCNYVALYNLDKLDDKAYIPVSCFLAVE